MATEVSEAPASTLQVQWSHEDIRALCVIARRKFDERTDLRCLHAKRLHDLLASFAEQILQHPNWLPQEWAEAAVGEIAGCRAPGYRGACMIFLCDIDFALREFYAARGASLEQLFSGYLQEPPE